MGRAGIAWVNLLNYKDNLAVLRLFPVWLELEPGLATIGEGNEEWGKVAWNAFLELLDQPVQPESEEAALKAVARLYHAYFTGLILHVTLTEGEEAAGDWTFRIFRRLHHEKFLASFDKLGLAQKPDPVAAAEYHYLSNSIGGVEVEFMPESDDKAWVRFCHPRWLYDGTALCGVPLSVSRGFLRGWYAMNGVSLGNDRMGFVCVSEDMTAEFGMSGYFKVFDHPLTEDERLQFARGEKPPRFSADKAPRLDATDWPAARLLKANRNYAMDYIRVGLFELQELLGASRAAELAGHTAALIGRQYYRAVQKLLGSDRQKQDPQSFADVWARLTQASGDAADFKGVPRAGCGAGALELHQTSWRLMAGEAGVASEMAAAWTRLFEGMVSVHDHHLTYSVEVAANANSPAESQFTWRVA